MGDGIKAWHDDMDDYYNNCHTLGVKERRASGGYGTACLSYHARWAEDKVRIKLGYKSLYPDLTNLRDEDFNKFGDIQIQYEPS